VQNLRGGGDRFAILPMLEVMPWPTIAVAQPVDGAVDRVHADVDIALLCQQLAQVADAPDRDGPAIGLWTSLQRFGKKGEVLRAQLRRPTSPRPVGEAIAPMLQEVVSPGPNAMRRGATQPSNTKNGLSLGNQEHGLCTLAHPRVWVGLDQAL
jgi:hypothetical protein